MFLAHCYNISMITTHSSRGLVWLDLESPTEDEIGGLVQRYGLHPLVGEELKSSPSLAKIEFYKDYVLVVLTLPVRIQDGTGYSIADREIDFVIGKSFLITSHADTIEQVEYFAKIFDANAVLDKNKQIEDAGHLFYYMVKRIYAGMCEDLENIRDSLVSAETHIFKGDERKMVEVLSGLSRELIDFRQTARIHREIWEDLIQYGDKGFFGKEFVQYVRDLRDDFNRTHDLITNARELLADLRETNDSLLDTKQNDIIKTLTIVTFIFYPATFIASLFTVPAGYVPLVGSQNGWWIIFALMVVVTAAIWWYIKRRRWL